MLPKVSVIIPIYNVEQKLDRCLNSIVNQTLSNIEIILVDDGSPDNSPKICDEYAQKDKRIRVIHKSNGGLSDARNAGLTIAKGEYIIFIDSDDWSEDIMLETLYSRAYVDGSDIVVCSYSVDYSNNNFSVKKQLQNGIFCTEKIPEAIYMLDENGMFNVVWNKLYKHSVLKKSHLSFEIDGVPGEDLLFNCLVFKKIRKISFEKEILHHYMREDEDTLVKAYKPNLYSQVRRFNGARKSLYDFYNMSSKKEMREYANKYVENIFACVPNIFRKNNNLTIQDKIKLLDDIIKDEGLKSYLIKPKRHEIYERIFYTTIQTQNVFLMFITYSLLFAIRNYFDFIYRVVRKRILI
jgi:glycosyltransferase involved in cell wall biosynthesis